MDEKKKLRIFCFTDYSLYGDAAVGHAALLCRIFRADLCIFPLKQQQIYSASFTHIIEIAQKENINISHATECPNLNHEIYRVSEEENAMMMVISVDKKKKNTYFTPRKALQFIKKSRIPILAVGKTQPALNAYQNVILPLDSSIFSKEKSLWASYFSRFYNAYVHILYKKYKDEFLRHKLKENVGFTEKLYANLQVFFKKHPIDYVPDDIDDYAHSFAPSVDGTLILSMTTKYLTLFDIILGTREQKTIKYVDIIPYLYINQRDDLYVLCT